MIIQEMNTNKVSFEEKPRIMIIGIGGAGGNMLQAIIDQGLSHISSLALNTDAQALESLSIKNKILLGEHFLRGLGTGANSDIGKTALESEIDNILKYTEGSDIVFLLAGLGGGTGSGATPTLAKILQEKDILTVSIVAKPFIFEGSKRTQIAQQAIEQIEEYSDTVISIPNQRLFDSEEMKNLSLEESFDKVNTVVANSIKAVVDTIFSPGSINIDFADIKATMKKMGRAIIGIGKGSGEERALEAIKNAVNSPLLENNYLHGASSIIINVSSDSSLLLHEINTIASYIHDEAHPNAHIILGTSIQKNQMKDIIVTIIVTGFENSLKQNNEFISATKINEKKCHCCKENKNPSLENQNCKNFYDSNLDIPTYLRNQINHK